MPVPDRPVRLWFGLLLLLAASHVVFLIADRRLPRAHATRAYYELQYSILSGCGGPGEVPLWLPFGDAASPAGPALARQAGLFQLALMLAGPAAAGWNFLTLFHIGMFVEELLFLVGCWALARRLFAAPATSFFVAVAALGSSFWLYNVGVAFHAVYALPLLMALLHRFLRDGSKGSLLLAGNLAGLQALGSPAGVGLVAPAAAVLYFAGRQVVLGEGITRRLAEMAWTRRDGLLALGLLAGWAVVATAAWPAGAAAPPPRPTDVLVAAGLSNPLGYAELILGINANPDWSAFCGYFTLAFAAIALMSAPRRVAIRFFVSLPCGLILLGGLLVLLAAAVPAFRPAPIPNVGTPIVRLLIVFLAGAGFDLCLREHSGRRLRAAGGLLAVCTLLLVPLAFGFAIFIPGLEDLLRRVMAAGPETSGTTLVLDTQTASYRIGAPLGPDILGASAVAAALASGVLFLWGSGRRTAPLALALLFLLHPLDLMNWKFRTSWLATFSASPEQDALQKIVRPPFPARPVPSLDRSERFAAFHNAPARWLPPLHGPRGNVDAESSGYWFAKVGAGRDETLHVFGSRAGNERLPARPEVEEFTPNLLRARVDAPPDGAVLVYDDTWDPAWTATVNGAPREIARSDHGGKALRLDAGRNVVEFRYRSPGRSVAFFLLELNALFWLGWIVRAAARAGWRGAEVA